MSNEQVAQTLDRIADLYALKGGNAYRVRAYQRAAAEIRGVPEPLEEIDRLGKLEAIPGVGPSIADKVRDIIRTGTTSVYEELKSQYPEGLIEVMALPEVGPRTAKLLHKKLGIKSVDELEQAAKEHRISRETDLGERFEQNILRGIELMRSGALVRINLGQAWTLADEIMSGLRKVPGVQRISEAGSLRRRQDTIGDLDLVAETTDVDALNDAFTHLPCVKEVIETGRTMTSVRVHVDGHGLRMDLRMSPAEHYGAMLHHFTGGKQHSIKLRGLANDKGLTINDYGVSRLDSGEMVTPGRTEDDIYEAIGLPWIPPELREDRGEIEAAREGRLPRLVEQDDIKGDLHMHTTASDGANSLEQMAEAARARGYRYIAVCDHSKSLGIANGLSPERLLKRIERVRELNEKLDGFRVLVGSEVDILSDGRLDYECELLEKLDIVVASIHHRYRQDRDKMTARVVRALETGFVDILAHPTGRLINQREPLDMDMDRVFEVAKAHSTAMEINCYPDRLDLNDIYARSAKDHGLKLSIDTDAHMTPELANIRFGLAQARRAWLEPSDTLNTWPLDDLLTWLQVRRSRALASV
jgi:DNA polymerase (family X)